MANLSLYQYLPDAWFTVYRKNLDQYIDHFGQMVRLLKRSQATYNQYSDIISSINIATTESAIVSKNPLESNFMGPPLIYADDTDSLAQYMIYFRSDSLARINDIVVIETKSIEGDVVLDAYEIGLIKGKKTGQEYIRRHILMPFRDVSSSAYEDPSILTTDEIVETHTTTNVLVDSGGFSEDFYNTTDIVPPPGTRGFVTPDLAISITNFSEDPYGTDYPAGWNQDRPYDTGKQLVGDEIQE